MSDSQVAHSTEIMATQTKQMLLGKNKSIKCSLNKDQLTCLQFQPGHSAESAQEKV